MHFLYSVLFKLDGSFKSVDDSIFVEFTLNICQVIYWVAWGFMCWSQHANELLFILCVIIGVVFDAN